MISLARKTMLNFNHLGYNSLRCMLVLGRPTQPAISETKIEKRHRFNSSKKIKKKKNSDDLSLKSSSTPCEIAQAWNLFGDGLWV